MSLGPLNLLERREGSARVAPTPSGPVQLPLSGAELRRYRRVERLADLLDNAFRIPGTRWRFGLDPLLGLIPGLGDALGAIASAWIVLEAARFGASAPVLLRMLYNIAIDTALGAIPGAGDAFDFAWKSDSKNLALLRRHLKNPETTHRASRQLLLLVMLALVGVAIGSVVIVILLIKYLIAHPSHF